FRPFDAKFRDQMWTLITREFSSLVDDYRTRGDLTPIRAFLRSDKYIGPAGLLTTFRSYINSLPKTYFDRSATDKAFAFPVLPDELREFYFADATALDGDVDGVLRAIRLAGQFFDDREHEAQYH